MWPQNLILLQFFSRNDHIFLACPLCKNMTPMLMTRVVFASSKLRKIFEEWRWFKARGLHSQMIGGYVRCTNFDNFQPRRNLIKIVLIGKRTLIVFDPKYSNCSLDSCSFQLNINIIVQERGTFDPLLRGPSIRPYTTVQLDTGAHLSQKFKSNFSKFMITFY